MRWYFKFLQISRGMSFDNWVESRSSARILKAIFLGDKASCEKNFIPHSSFIIIISCRIITFPLVPPIIQQPVNSNNPRRYDEDRRFETFLVYIIAYTRARAWKRAQKHDSSSVFASSTRFLPLFCTIIVNVRWEKLRAPTETHETWNKFRWNERNE